MNTAYDATDWNGFFVMAGGAGAALAGLLFVAVSLNHEQILANPTLPPLSARALGTLIVLVIQCALGLAPGQSVRALGVETIGVGLALSWLVLASTMSEFKYLEQRRWRTGRLVLSLASMIPTLAAGISIVAGWGGGLFWILVEVIVGFGLSGYTAWILLIEIRR